MRICGIFLPSLLAWVWIQLKPLSKGFFPYLTCDQPGEFLKIIIFKTGVKTSCCISARCLSGPCDLFFYARVLKKMEVRIQQEFCLNDNEQMQWWIKKSHTFNPSIFLLAVPTCGQDSSLATCFGIDIVDLNST